MERYTEAVDGGNHGAMEGDWMDYEKDNLDHGRDASDDDEDGGDEEDRAAESGEQLTVHLDTESGLLALIVPTELRHWADNHSWWTEIDNLIDEANSGRIVPIETGRDGGYAVRITFASLSEREQRFAAQSALFWLQVPEDEEVAVVSGEELSFPETAGTASFWASPGPYRVIVTRLRWTEEDDDAHEDVLPDYVVRLLPLSPGEVTPTIQDIPDLAAEDD